MAPRPDNIDPGEIRHFDRQARYWWDPKGPLKALHDINPLRLQYVEDRTAIEDRKILDVGCGGGILSESLASKGGRVTGIDLSDGALEAAENYRKKSGRRIDYQLVSPEALAENQPAGFDIVVCMELLEHVPDPGSVLTSCARLAKPGGDVFLSTINRTWAAYLLAILVAEDMLGIVEKGTHHYRKFVRPEELRRWGKDAGMKVMDCSGFMYVPFWGKAWLTRMTGVNYLMHLKKKG